MKYTIKVSYITGDSFGSCEDSQILSPVWDNEDDAYKALTELYEFNEFYSAYENERWTPEKQKRVTALAQKRPWAIPSDSSKWDFDDGIHIYHPDGRILIYTYFITGYFERLLNAEVIVDLESIDGWDDPANSVEALESKYGIH